MLRRHKDKAVLAVVRALTVFVSSFGVAAGLCGALFPMTDLGLLAALCGAGAVLFSLAAAFTEYWLFLYLPFCGAVIWAALGGGPLRGALNGLLAVLLYPAQSAGAMLLYRAELTRAIGSLAVLLCSAACLTDAPFLLGLLSAAALVPAYLTSPALPVLWAALAASGVLISLAHAGSGRARPGAVAVSAALIALSLVLAPVRPPESPALRGAAEDAYEILEAYLPAREDGYRAGYSLRTDGYLPLADDHNDFLGGSAVPENAPVMEVWTDQTVYLRGSPKNAYTGLSWQDTVSSRRYLYADVFQAAYRKTVLNQEIPQGAENEPLQTVRVRFTRDGATTLFVPDRTQELTAGEAAMVPYYNDASEIFLSRNLRAGDSYTLTYLPVSADRSRTRAWISAARTRDDPYYEEILDRYLSVPDQLRLNRSVTDLSSLAAGAQEDLLSRALSIRDWLRETFPYTLDVSDPPPNTDFVSWFLLGERKGYCTYFASAMTVLCRLQGIPARFVAGYLVRPDEDGYALVTGKMGHAWTEIYLRGFGWLTLDATPGTEETVLDDSPSGDPPQDEERPDPESTPGSDSTPTVPPVSGEEEEDEPGGTPEPDRPQPTPEPTAAPDSGAQAPADVLPWLALILPAALAFLIFRLTAADPVRAARRRPDQASRILFTAVETALAAAGRQRRAGETLDEYSRRIRSFFPGVPLTEAMDAYSADVYGGRTMKPALLTRVWNGVMKALSPWDRLRVRMKIARSRPWRRP